MLFPEMLSLLAKYQIKPRKGKGQNFLISKNILKKIIDAAELTAADNVLEIGPGLGVLTEELVERVKRVAAVELDNSLFYVMKQRFRGVKNLTLFNQDVLKLKIADLEKLFEQQPYKIVANIPYNITSNLIRKFLTVDYRPAAMVLMVQKEVAQRVMAKPGQMNLLALSVQFYCEPRIAAAVPSICFFPRPAVDSAILALKLKLEPAAADERAVFKLARAGFSSKRKQLHRNLADSLKLDRDRVKAALTKLGLPPLARAQELSVENWVALVGELRDGKLKTVGESRGEIKSNERNSW